MGKFLIFCLMTVLPAAARAQSVAVSVSPDDCARLTRGADYVAGFSTTGARVVPANLNAVPVSGVDDLTVYLDLRRDVSVFERGLRVGFPPVARVEFKNGGVFVNGVEVSENGLKALENSCRTQSAR